MGMGSSRTFDVEPDEENLQRLGQVLHSFFNLGGKVLDSSPMYGRAEAVLGKILSSMDTRPPLFAATKVWTFGKQAGVEQMLDSSQKMDVPVFDLMQIHNLRDWKIHLKTLRQWQDEGRVRHIGITTSHQRSHPELEQIMRTEKLDFVQFSYNIDNRLAEERLLPLAAERGIATMINRPFQRGKLFKKAAGQPLPGVAKDLACDSWGQFFSKFIIAHPAVTCLIPATGDIRHIQDNMGANFGPVPDSHQRAEMLRVYQAL
jgi:diketogulonate reductase-like aldo/keto reductase